MKLTFVSCCFLLFFSFVGYSQKAKTKSLIEKAIQYEKKRNFEKVIATYQKAIKSDKTYSDSYLKLAATYRLLGQKEDEIETYLSLLANCTNAKSSASIHLQLGEYYFKKSDFSKSSQYLSSYFDLVKESDTNYTKAKRLESRLQLVNQSNQQSQPKASKLFQSLLFVSYPVAINDTNVVVNVKMIENRKRSTTLKQAELTNGRWSALVSFSDRINTAIDQGGCALSKDGKTIVFTSCNREDSFGGCDLYICYQNESGEWSEPQNLGKEVNSSSWDSEPSLNADATKLYFSSRRAGGFGQEDIWYAEFENGKWSKAKNIGSPINTKDREVTPFVHPFANQLYIAKNGTQTIGGFDLFVSHFEDDKWSKPQNLGYPINTALHESAISFSEGGKYAYFARLKEAVNFGEHTSSHVMRIQLPDSLLVLEKPKTLKEKKFVFGGVLFEYASSELSPVFQQNLNDFIETIAKNKAEKIIVIEGHTDNEGTANFNQKLSEQRAFTVKEYLVRKGISGKYIQTVGKGSNEPIASNETSEGRAKNRRIEIKLITVSQ